MKKLAFSSNLSMAKAEKRRRALSQLLQERPSLLRKAPCRTRAIPVEPEALSAASWHPPGGYHVVAGCSLRLPEVDSPSRDSDKRPVPELEIERPEERSFSASSPSRPQPTRRDEEQWSGVVERWSGVVRGESGSDRSQIPCTYGQGSWLSTGQTRS